MAQIPQKQQTLRPPSQNSIYLSWTVLPLLGRSQLSLPSTESKKAFLHNKTHIGNPCKGHDVCETHSNKTVLRQSNPHLQAVQEDRCWLRLFLATTVPSYRRHTHTHTHTHTWASCQSKTCPLY
jgi:hypothetical protein